MARKVRSKRVTQFLDADYMKDVLQEMKNEEQAAPNLSALAKKQNKALESNFLQVEKPIATVSARKIENQYEALAKELADKIADKHFSDEVRFDYALYSSQGEWLASLPNQGMAGMYADIINGRWPEKAYIYARSSKSWVGEDVEKGEEFSEAYDCEYGPHYVLLAEDKSSVCPVGIFRDKAYMELYHEIQVTFCNKRYMAGVVTPDGYASTLGNALAWRDFFVLSDKAGIYNLGFSVAGMSKECTDFLQLCQQKYPAVLAGIRDYAESWQAMQDADKQDMDKLAKELTAGFLQDFGINKAYKNFFQAIYRRLLAAVLNEHKLWSGNEAKDDSLHKWFFVKYFNSDITPLYTLGRFAPCFLRQEMSWQEACSRIGEYYPGSATSKDFPQQAWNRMQYIVLIDGSRQEMIAGFRYIYHASALVGYLSARGIRAIIKKLSTEVLNKWRLAEACGIYDVADSMCMLLAISLREAYDTAISKLIKDLNGREHIAHPLIYHADIQRAFVYKFFIKFRQMLNLDAEALFHSGYIDKKQDVWQEIEKNLLANTEPKEIKKQIRIYTKNAKGAVSRSSVSMMMNIMLCRRLYEACYNPHRQTKYNLTLSSDIHCYIVVARGWKPGIYLDMREGDMARQGFSDGISNLMTNRFFADKFFHDNAFKEQAGKVFYAVEAGTKFGITDEQPLQGRIVMHSENLAELLTWGRYYRLQKNAMLKTPYLPPKVSLSGEKLPEKLKKLFAMLTEGINEPALPMPRYAESQMSCCIKMNDEEGKVLAVFRYREQAEAVCSKLAASGQNVEVRTLDGKLPLAMLPVAGIYDVSDAMHFLLAACQEVEMSAAIAAVLDELKQRTHRIELLADQFVMDIAAMDIATLINAAHSEQMWHSSLFDQHVLYAGIWKYIGECVRDGIEKPEIMLQKLYVKHDIALRKMSDQIFAPSFLLCWSRYMYERHYQPMTAEKEPMGAEVRQVTAVVRAGRNGVFIHKSPVKRLEKFPETRQQAFLSSWGAEFWISLNAWPVGDRIRYYVISRDGHTLEMTSDDCLECYALYKDASPVNALRVLYQLKDSNDIEEKRRSYFYGRLRSKYKNMKKAKLKAERLRKKQQKSLAATSKQLESNKLSQYVEILPQADSVKGKPENGEGKLSKGETERKGKVSAPKIGHIGKGHELFRGIQFDKHIFRNTSQEYQQRFQKTIAGRLSKLENILKGNVRAAGNDFRLVSVGKRRRVYKHRVGSQRLSMVLKDGVITLLRMSNHDRQMVDIRQIQGSTVGYIYYDMDDFLQQVHSWQQRGSKQQNLGDYLSSPNHYVYDSAQKNIIEAGNKFVNISIVGNAGAGKSVVGLKWLDDVLKMQTGNCLYLTMSENLVYTLGYELRKSAAAVKANSRVDIETTFAFLQKCFKKYYPQIPEKCLLNGAQSLDCFRSFWQEEVDWRWFWNTKDEKFAYQTEETTLLAAWRDIHGILKGASVESVDLRHGYSGSEMLSEDEYIHKLRQTKKASVPSVLWIKILYKVGTMYQKYLRRCNLYDDNDIARMLLSKNCRCEKKYRAVFLDECQDLTQLELLSLFFLLEGTSNKRMASDRCQMVQPTYFHEGWMRTTVNEYDKSMGRTIEPQGEKPFYLHYNYRSSRSIIDFQNFIVQYFDDSGILTLKQNELMEIKVPPLTIQGMKPIWICPSDANQRLLIENLWQQLDAASLQTIFAFQHSDSKKDFESAKPMTDVITCKGMEYPSVLLYNVLTEVQFDSLLAWKYFYVGATRSNGCLLIYEKGAVPGTDIYQFLQDAADLEIVDKCESLQEDCPYTNGNWLAYIYQGIKENMADNKIETAENALNFGQYELALDIYLRDGKEQEMIDYCRGKAFEQKKDYCKALVSYERLPAGWFSQGRTRKNSAESILRKPDVEGREFLGAYMLTAAARGNMLEAAKEAWKYKYGHIAGFYEALYGAVAMYETSREALGGCLNDILHRVEALDALCHQRIKTSWEE